MQNATEKTKRQVVVIKEGYIYPKCVKCGCVMEIIIRGRVKGNYDIPCARCKQNIPFFVK